MTTMPTTDEPLVLRSDRADGLTTLTLNRPGQFNSLSKDMLTALQAELDAIAASEAIRVVIIAGAGKADHQTVADKLVVAHAAESGDIFNAHGVALLGKAQRGHQAKHARGDYLF